ncbi:MAG: hypothetical protein AAF479_15115 [Pseudomonadota bacterium]
MARSFESPMMATVYLSAIDLYPIRMHGREEPLDAGCKDIDWSAFLAGVAMHPKQIEYCAEYLEKHNTKLSVSVLVHIVKLFYDAGVANQGLPSSAQLVDQLREMGRAAAKLSNLAQGFDGKGQPTDEPNWFTSENGFDVKSDGSLHPTLQRATPHIHPMLHEALHRTRASNFLGGFPQGEAERRAWNNVGIFFSHLRLWVDTIETAADEISSTNKMTKTPAKRPADDARKWALSRLLWVWRDVIKQPIKLSMTMRRDRVELDEPEPGPCIAFVLSAMEHMEPVRPHMYRALQTELNRARRVVPNENLVKS